MRRNARSETRYSRRNGSSPWRTTFPMQSRNAPTPGKTIPRQEESAPGSPLTRVGEPRDSRALLTLRRFPIPYSTTPMADPRVMMRPSSPENPLRGGYALDARIEFHRRRHGASERLEHRLDGGVRVGAVRHGHVQADARRLRARPRSTPPSN